MNLKSNNKTIVICGAGIAGVATAYYISKFRKEERIVLIDKNQPLSFTTSKSGENFRDYWPHPCMEKLSSRSIDLMKGLRKEFKTETFDMNFSGYHFVSHLKDQPIFADDSSTDFQEKNIVDKNQSSIQQKYPYLDDGIQKSVFIKNAGKIDVYQLGSLLLKEGRKNGVELISGEILNIKNNKSAIEIILSSTQSLRADQLVITAGPFINNIGKMIGLRFPISNILQRKFILPDPLNIIPSDMPFTIYADSQFLSWTQEEKTFFDNEIENQWLLKKFPGGIHIKPEPGGKIKMGWAFQRKKEEPKWDFSTDDLFPQIVLKGASRFIPNLKSYEENIPTPLIQYAGYYTKTAENWPLIGPTKLDNVFVVGALSGFGTMTACAAGELCAKYIFGKDIPDFATYFTPNRYENLKILNEINAVKNDGQL